MGVHVDPAGRHQEPVGVDLTLRRSLLAADRRNLAVGNGDVAGEGSLAGAVHDRAATKYDVVHASLPMGAAPMPACSRWTEYRLRVGRQTSGCGVSLPC